MDSLECCDCGRMCEQTAGDADKDLRLCCLCVKREVEKVITSKWNDLCDLCTQVEVANAYRG